MIVSEHRDELGGAAALLLISGFPLAYSILMHAWKGQTLGKMVCDVAVRDLSEGPLSIRQAVLRDVFPLLVYLGQVAIFISVAARRGNPSAFLENAFDGNLKDTGSLWTILEIVTMLTNPKRRALHDFIAGSVVMRTT